MGKFEKCKGFEDDIYTKLPTRGTKHSVGYDLYSPTSHAIQPGAKELILTNIKCKLNEGEWLGVFSRSSMAKLNAHFYLGCGVIDGDYYGNPDNDGNIGVIIENTGDSELVITTGDRIAQGIFFPRILADDDEGVSTERVSGFGSTGV